MADDLFSIRLSNKGLKNVTIAWNKIVDGHDEERLIYWNKEISYESNFINIYQSY